MGLFDFFGGVGSRLPGPSAGGTSGYDNGSGVKSISLPSEHEVYEQRKATSANPEAIRDPAGNIINQLLGAGVVGGAALGAANWASQYSVKELAQKAAVAKEAINTVKHPEKYLDSVIPDSWKDVYSTIDNFIETYLPAPASLSNTGGSDRTFNSPSQVYSVKNNDMLMLGIAVAAGVIIYYARK